MDLLGDIGAADQLTSARSENAVLQKRVKELTLKVKELTVENEALKAEVEMYRKENAAPTFSKMALGQTNTADMEAEETPDEFIRSGDGTFPSDNAVSLEGLHEKANPLCCALNPEDSILLTGGADAHLNLCQWGGALSPTPDAAAVAIKKAVRLPCPGPVICADFSKENFGKKLPVVAVGCMDGSIKLASYSATFAGLTAKMLTLSSELKHTKYVKAVVWSPTASILATASADGTVSLSKLTDLQDDGTIKVNTFEKLHMSDTVESLCFSMDGKNLICYTRGTPYLSFFDLEDSCKQAKINLNRAGGAAVGGFEDHVSFAVMDMAVSPNGKYIVLATDTSRNIVIDAVTGKQIRNLYGHTNDGFSNPKIGWSRNGQYVFGNTQQDGTICVWDVASSAIVKRLEGHINPVRDMFSSKLSDTLVTVSFDKQAKLWLIPM